MLIVPLFVMFPVVAITVRSALAIQITEFASVISTSLAVSEASIETAPKSFAASVSVIKASVPAETSKEVVPSESIAPA